jgi:F-type H+-transporting ATPase subunit gamma
MTILFFPTSYQLQAHSYPVPSLIETRKKIRSVHQTRKITRAMQLVSAAKMKVFQKRAISIRQYAWDLLETLKQYLTKKMVSEWMEQRKAGKTVFVLYSSDKGLCGPLNGRLQRALLGSAVWKNTDPKNRLLITIGKKAYDFAQYNEIPIERHIKGMKENLTTLDALDFIQHVLYYWRTYKVKQIYMVAPHFKSTLVFYPLVKTFLPFSFDMISENLNVEGEVARLPLQKKIPSYMIYEPSKERIIDMLFEQIITMLFMQSFLELKAAEYSSRMVAMKSATDNAGDLIDELTLIYNKARQAKITQELAEMAGTMAAI